MFDLLNADLFLSLFLFLAAWVGHSALMVAAHNQFYGLATPKGAGKFIHVVFGLFTFLFPLGLWSVAGWDPRSLFVYSSGFSWHTAAAGYVALCWLSGLVLFPLNTLRRLLRTTPPALLDSRSRVVDIAQQLGCCPVGTRTKRHLCRLPGNQALQVELAEHTLRLPRLPPAWDGLTLLHLSDLHLSGTPDRDYFRAVMDHCRAWEPDLVCVTGDVADSMHHKRWIVPVLGRLRWKIAAFAILGNHDSWYEPQYVRRRLRRLGMQVLANTWQQLEVRGEPLVVVGHEGPWFKPEPDLSDAPAEPFRLCLSHTPDNIAWARRQRIDLMLSGHVHGGQVRVPVFGSILVPSKYGRWYDSGLFDEPPTLLHVNRGLSGEHPLRYNCRPEATLLTLRAP
jgi:predicted MPP superfamily phosphohydrolase